MVDRCHSEFFKSEGNPQDGGWLTDPERRLKQLEQKKLTSVRYNAILVLFYIRFLRLLFSQVNNVKLCHCEMCQLLSNKLANNRIKLYILCQLCKDIKYTIISSLL